MQRASAGAQRSRRPVRLPACRPACSPACLLPCLWQEDCLSAHHSACPPCPCHPLTALQTICFEGHDPLIVVADNMPIQPIRTSSLGTPGCIDLYSGQR